MFSSSVFSYSQTEVQRHTEFYENKYEKQVQKILPRISENKKEKLLKKIDAFIIKTDTAIMADKKQEKLLGQLYALRNLFSQENEISVGSPIKSSSTRSSQITEAQQTEIKQKKKLTKEQEALIEEYRQAWRYSYKSTSYDQESFDYYKKAESIYKNNNIEVNDFEIYYRFWVLSTNMEKYEEAKKYLQKASDIKPEWSYISDAVLADVHYLQWNTEEADKVILQAQKVEPLYYWSHRVYLKIHQDDLSIEEYRKYVEKTWNDFIEFYEKPENKEVVAFLDSTWKYGFSKITMAHFYGSAATDFWDQPEIAEDFLLKAIEVELYPNAVRRLALAQINQEKYHQAEESLLFLYKISPYTLDIYTYLSYIYVEWYTYENIENKIENLSNTLEIFKEVLDIYDTEELWDNAEFIQGILLKEWAKEYYEDQYEYYEKQLQDIKKNLKAESSSVEMTTKSSVLSSWEPEWYKDYEQERNNSTPFSNTEVIQLPSFENGNITFSILNYTVWDTQKYEGYLNNKKISSGIIDEWYGWYSLKNVDLSWYQNNVIYDFYLKNTKSWEKSQTHKIFKWKMLAIEDNILTCNLNFIWIELRKKVDWIYTTVYKKDRSNIQKIDIQKDSYGEKLDNWEYIIMASCGYLDEERQKWWYFLQSYYSIENNTVTMLWGWIEHIDSNGDL